MGGGSAASTETARWRALLAAYMGVKNGQFNVTKPPDGYQITGAVVFIHYDTRHSQSPKHTL